jgi:glycosyltransferase involved in cell wall biosynthesis
VSAVIPVHGRAHTVAPAVASVRAQTFGDLELVVIDDGSPPSEAEAIANLPGIDRHRRFTPAAGGSEARNRGVREARGRYVAFLDQDDVWHPDKIERQVEILEREPEAALTYCHFEQVDEHGRTIDEQVPHWLPEPDPIERMLRGNVIKSCSLVLVRRDAFDEVGGFEPSLRSCGDWDLWLRIAQRGHRFVPDDEIRVDYRVHPGQLSGDQLLQRRENVAVLERAWPWVESHRPDLRRYLAGRMTKALRKQARAELQSRSGDVEAARRALRRAARLRPFDLKVRLELLRVARARPDRSSDAGPVD